MKFQEFLNSPLNKDRADLLGCLTVPAKLKLKISLENFYVFYETCFKNKIAESRELLCG